VRERLIAFVWFGSAVLTHVCLNPGAQDSKSIMKHRETKGSCLCGSIQYSIESEPLTSLHCHCSDCRKATGAPFVTWAVFPRTAFTLTANAPKRFDFAGRIRLFCSACGTALAYLPSDDSEIIAVTVGSLEGADDCQPAFHCWTKDKLSWIHLADSLPAYETTKNG